MSKGLPIAVICPAEVGDWCVDNNYLTAGKQYSILEQDENIFKFMLDNGGISYCLWKNCAFLRGCGKDWIPVYAEGKPTETQLEFQFD